MDRASSDLDRPAIVVVVYGHVGIVACLVPVFTFTSGMYPWSILFQSELVDPFEVTVSPCTVQMIDTLVPAGSWATIGVLRNWAS
ncbi:hypothetical protein ACI2LC_15230 [Nonomuraea wenchangensis]|uniref:hypothetical protein n=1 Tax=Nonomuraea wenchangensis TaxID=568860 RepID=UPI0033FCB602